MILQLAAKERGQVEKVDVRKHIKFFNLTPFLCADLLP